MDARGRPTRPCSRTSLAQPRPWLAAPVPLPALDSCLPTPQEGQARRRQRQGSASFPPGLEGTLESARTQERAPLPASHGRNSRCPLTRDTGSWRPATTTAFILPLFQASYDEARESELCRTLKRFPSSPGKPP